MFKFFNRKNLKPKCQTPEEYWHERNNRNKQKAAFLEIDYNKELKDSSFLDQRNKYKTTEKGI